MADIPFDPVAWGSNPYLAWGALTAFVAWFRTTPSGKRVDGPIIVPAFTLALGGATGAFLQFANLLAYEPYASWGTPLGGIAYGLLTGASAVAGVSLFNYGAGKLADGGGIVRETATNFIVNFLKARFGESIPGRAWEAVGPLILQFGASDVVLTDEMRRELQAKILAALRKAGLVGQDL